MTQASGYKRYWRKTENGIERITSYVDVDDSWNRGIGPIDTAKHEGWLATLRATHLGKPKPESQIRKMKDASAGKPKSQDHVNAMRAAHLERSRLIKQVQHELNCTWSEACAEFRLRKAKS